MKLCKPLSERSKGPLLNPRPAPPCGRIRRPGILSVGRENYADAVVSSSRDAKRGENPQKMRRDHSQGSRKQSTRTLFSSRAEYKSLLGHHRRKPFKGSGRRGASHRIGEKGWRTDAPERIHCGRVPRPRGNDGLAAPKNNITYILCNRNVSTK